MAIYSRDNLAASITPGLASALDRAQAYRARQNARIKDSFKAITDYAPIIGRTVEQGFTPDKYKDDKDYRAARYDYIFNGDRSGLDAYNQRDFSEAEAEKQRAFQAAENALNRQASAAENAANRAIQREQLGLSRTTEKAKMWRDINDADALVSDIENHPEKYGGVAAAALDLAKAKHGRDLALSMAAESGLFTGTELKPFQSVNLSTPPNTPPAADTPPAAPAAPAVDWTAGSPEVSRLYDEAKTLKDIAAADEKFKALGVPETKTDAYQALVAKQNAATKRVNDSVAAAAKRKAFTDTVENTAFSAHALRKALGIGKEGGGQKEAKVKVQYNHNGKTYEDDVRVVNNDGVASIIVGDNVIQTVPLYGKK